METYSSLRESRPNVSIEMTAYQTVWAIRTITWDLFPYYVEEVEDDDHQDIGSGIAKAIRSEGRITTITTIMDDIH